MRRKQAILAALLPLLWLALPAAGLAVEAPPALEAWKSWVLHGRESATCPRQGTPPGAGICVLPGLLTLGLNDAGGEFQGVWRLEAPALAALPHAQGLWPQDVRLAKTAPPPGQAGPTASLAEGALLPLADRDGVPMVRLPAGTHTVTGRFVWQRLPESLQLDPATGLARLTVLGEVRERPMLSPAGVLRLRGEEQSRETNPPAGAEHVDVVEARVYRKLVDDIPALLTTRVSLSVSGPPRRIVLEAVLPAGFTPVAARGPVTVDVLTAGDDARPGDVAIQAGPGRWNIEIDSLALSPLSELPALPAVPSRPGDQGGELWVFEARPALREVEISGAARVDGQTTDLPAAWKSLPAFLLQPGDTLRLTQLHRGLAERGQGNLTLERDLWLDFDGGGFTARDQVQGQLGFPAGDRGDGQDFLVMRPAAAGGFDLGRATMRSEDQPILLLGERRWPGVATRHRELHLVAESRLPHREGVLAATGWDRDFASVTARLMLPPGWSLLSVQGVDRARDTWLSRWDLLDLFVVLLAGLAAWRLGGRLAGATLLACLILGYHEPHAPRLLWLLVLGSLALCRLTREADATTGAPSPALMARLPRLAHGLGVVLLLLAAVPFCWTQMQRTLFPQLGDRPASGVLPSGPLETATWLMSAKPTYDMARSLQSATTAPARPPAKGPLMHDPQALVQTGPGVPAWRWSAVELRWSGPVSRDQTVTLWLLSPGWVAAFRVLRVLLLVAAVTMLADFRRLSAFWRMFPEAAATPGAGAVARCLPASLALLGALGLAGALAGPAWASSEGAPVPIPDNATPATPAFMPAATPAATPAFTPAAGDFQTLLDEYRQRLLAPPDCHPHCLGSPWLSVLVEGQRLELEVQLHAQARVLAPLPEVASAQPGLWQPWEITVDGHPETAMHRDKGRPWILLEPGAHRVRLRGPLPHAVSFTVALALPAAQGTIRAPGWQASGQTASGALESVLRFSRSEAPGVESGTTSAPPAASLPPSTSRRLEPFFRVSRELTLGLAWELETTVTVETPLEDATVLDVPLLPGEAVLTPGVVVEGGAARATLDASRPTTGWRSRLALAERLELTAPVGKPWGETWSLEAAPIWEVREEPGGPPAIQRHDQDRLRPVWRPWPGERLALSIRRPAPAPGRAMTIREVRHDVTLGHRLDDHVLSLDLLASQGGRHRLRLPKGAIVTTVTRDGTAIPWNMPEPDLLDTAVIPGRHAVKIAWNAARPRGGLPVWLETPRPQLLADAANVDVRVSLPRDRWVLWTWGDPALGPAVAFWAYLALLLPAAWALGRFTELPLRRRDWFLLGVGLSQLPVVAAFLAVAWLPALAWRKRRGLASGWTAAALTQLALPLLAATGLGCLLYAVHTGLLGEPGMQIKGNGSGGWTLRWTMDRVPAAVDEGALPVTGALSVPMAWYRGLMLAWALWLAWSLLDWLRWGWRAWTAGGMWRALERRSRRAPSADAPLAPRAPQADASSAAPREGEN